jgi:hypothetical protein
MKGCVAVAAAALLPLLLLQDLLLASPNAGHGLEVRSAQH